MKVLLSLTALIWGSMAGAQDVLVIGEIHDNPAHHELQAKKVAELAPKALVFEMIAPERTDGQVLPQFHDPDGLEKFLQWDASGWPDFAMYLPVFMAAPEARIYGAHVSRDQARRALEQGLAASFGDKADAYGLTGALPPYEQEARETLQMQAHCDALPLEMLPGMVRVQRLRDAVLARAVVRAVADTGGPVAVITGNGHARKDWGIPAVLARVAPGLDVWVIGQTEAGQPLQGGFDEVISAPVLDRPDPCLAFQ